MNKRRGRPRKRQVSIEEEEPRRPSPPPRKQPRRVAASCSSFREEWEEEHEEVAVNGGHPEEEKSVDENAALALTVVGDEHPPPFRRLFDFVLHDADGALLPFEMAGVIEVFMTGRVVPASGDDLKGVLCRRLGKIESWDVSGYESGQLSISVWTEMAKYECCKPARGYKKFFDAFSEKVRAAAEVYRVLLKSQKRAGGLGVDELVAGVVRSMSGCFTDGIAGSNFVFSIGDFIHRELQQFDGLASMPALLALRDECRSRMEFQNPSLGSALRIGEEKRSKEEGEAVGGDEKLARLLQEEEDRKLMRKQRGRRREPPRSKLYIKISEAEMAEDYPLPAFYKPLVHEMDEYLFLPEECELDYGPVEQEARVLNNWSVYNSDSRMVSLELLPMKPCAENDVPVFGSGSMTEGEAYAYCVETEPGQSSYSCSPSVHSSEGVEGIPIYLSAIKEWMIEYGASMIFVLIRTDVAWYRLGRPSKQYTPWHEAVVRIARLAVSIIKMLKEESRVSRLSFVDVIKKISEFGRAHPSHISSAVAEVERYVVVHGQIILQIFTVYPDKTINKCAFVTGLSEKMEERRHTKLVMNKKKVTVQRETNLNPNAEAEPVASKRKVMRATMTRLINRIWGDYYSNYFPEDAKEGNDCEVKEGQVEPEDEHEQEETDEEDAVEENAPAEESALQQSSSSMANKKSLDSVELRWEGESICGKGTDEALYRCAMVNGERIRVGGAVMVYIDESSHVPALVFVEYMFESKNGLKMLHGRVLSKGSETLLGNAANEREVFLTHDCIEIELGNVKKPVVVDVRSVPWGHEYRKEQAESAVIDREKAEERKKKGLDVEFYCKSLYWPEKGAFFSLPLHTIGLGSGVCSSCRLRDKQKEDFQMNSGENIFTYNDTEYRVGDFVYVKPQFFSEPKEIGKFKAGRNVGLKPYTVCHLLEIQVLRKCKKITPDSVHAKIRRFYRPEDVSAEKAYCSDIREVYYSEEILSVPLEMIEGKCEVWRRKDLPNLDSPVLVDHIFFCEHSYDAGKGSVNQLPSNVKSMFESTKPADSHLRDRKGKGKCKEGEDDENFSQNGEVRDNRLATLDIFAGCGGLSEGLQRSGVSHTKWAIEYEQPAGEAFSSNHPMAEVFVDNCNVILRAIMQKGGDVNDCIATPEATELASKLEYEKINNLPMPGQVDFINGGPPCQGFSGMNRFNHGTWSKVQCEMILAFLSFADYFRPRFFLLENVRNFVSYNKGQTFQLTVASLLEMGYQVRFGVLEAGAFGVSQSRKRAFIWAASPQETLPEWPEPMHVFAGPELKISLPRGVQYSASRSTASGAPFRSITVRDTIGDLPPVGNGASRLTIDYESDPVSWFQKQIRGKNMMALNDHISKEMNELNFIRCQRIPKQPGADWRNLPDEKVKLSNGQMVDLIPWCLPNTAKRHNQWKGLFGRLDWEGNFPTSITDPQPMGKVGMCFHPHQDRILTVRECARSQGFSDSYIFCGSIQNKHRQIGNAVPPPLAYALGMKLKEAVGNNAKH